MATPASTAAIVDFFRCPEWFADSELSFQVSGTLASAVEYVLSADPFGPPLSDGRLSSAVCARIINMLRYEHYRQAESDTSLRSRLVREAYYFIRPLLGVSLRRHLQRHFLRGWTKRPFPHWPVDRTVDELHEKLLIASLKRKSVDRVPFIWFWPDGHLSCALVTHDVEAEAGLKFCPALMDMDQAAGIVSSFQLVPEHRYPLSPETVAGIRARGFEVNIHDLNHDGHLFRDRETFRRRAAQINAYGEKYGCLGFRAGALYRNQDWYAYLKFSYDMSVPNVAHLDPQHGGCCTVFPYFVGDLLELPVTATQDYSLFHVLGSYSLDLWQAQMSEVVRHHGMVHVITHPDYVIDSRARQAYALLLAYVRELRDRDGVWITQPAQVNTWWRQRARMKLEWSGDRWAIVGEGHERAAVAYARLQDGQLVYEFPERSAFSRASSGFAESPARVDFPPAFA